MSVKKVADTVKNGIIDMIQEVAKLKTDTKQEYDAIITRREEVGSRIEYLQGLLDAYKNYEPYIKNHKEQWALKGFARKKNELLKLYGDNALVSAMLKMYQPLIKDLPGR